MTTPIHESGTPGGWIDVSLPIQPDMPVYPGDPPVELAIWSSLSAGEPFAVSTLSLGTHTGTHVDAPAHCIPGGAGVDALPLDALCGPACVFDLADTGEPVSVIGRASLLALPAGCERLLLRTHDGRLWRGEALPDAGLELAAASLLVERGVRLVGIDRLSIAPAGDPRPVHQALLEAGIVILEGLDLRAAPGGPCQLLCLPLKLAGADGAPARVVLRY